MLEIGTAQQDVSALAGYLHQSQAIAAGAYRSGIYALQGFVRILKQDLDAVQNAVTEPWISASG